MKSNIASHSSDASGISSKSPKAIARTLIPFRSGKRIRMSLPRRFVCDLLHFAKKVPSLSMERKMQLGDLVQVRSMSNGPRISWCAIFLKAYSIVAARHSELRRAYIPFPIPTIYEHPENVASFSIERDYEGAKEVFFAKVARPEELSLRDLDELIRYHKVTPIDAIPSFRQSLLLSRLPRSLRRFLWWLGLNTNGSSRAQHFGTLAISVVASLGGASLQILSPITTTLNYSQFNEDGSIDVRISYDHRVMDGGTVARLAVALESVLRGEILSELVFDAALHETGLGSRMSMKSA